MTKLLFNKKITVKNSQAQKDLFTKNNCFIIVIVFTNFETNNFFLIKIFSKLFFFLLINSRFLFFSLNNDAYPKFEMKFVNKLTVIS